MEVMKRIWNRFTNGPEKRGSTFQSSPRGKFLLSYSLETAVADIIDNSISANADRIDIIFEYNADGPIFAIIDNGHGMSSDELKEAMRLGAKTQAEVFATPDMVRSGR